MSDFADIEQSDYYQHWLEERREIEKHKWVLSEQAHTGVGWSYAQWDWIMRYRARWLASKRYQQSGHQTQT